VGSLAGEPVTDKSISAYETIYLASVIERSCLGDNVELDFISSHFKDYGWSSPGLTEAYEIILKAKEYGVKLDHQFILSQPRVALTQARLAELLTSASVSQNLEFYRAKVLVSKRSDEATKTAIKISAKARSGYFNFSDEIASLVGDPPGKRKALFSSQDLVSGSLDYLDSLIEGTLPKGMKTGLPSLDRITGGFHQTDLVIIAARPSMGKTAFALNLFSKMIFSGSRCAFFSMEMTSQKVMNRMISMNARVPASCFNSGDFSNEQIDRVTAYLKKMHSHTNFCISDEMEPIEKIREKLKLASQEMGGLDVIFIDYLGLIPVEASSFGSREREIAHISSELKKMARKYSCVVIALSQLSRGVESRTNKRPLMSDLRDSGSIEQDADQVLMLYRDDYYNKESTQTGSCEVIVGKNRNGETGIATLMFKPGLMLFTEKPQTFN